MIFDEHDSLMCMHYHFITLNGTYHYSHLQRCAVTQTVDPLHHSTGAASIGHQQVVHLFALFGRIRRWRRSFACRHTGR